MSRCDRGGWLRVPVALAAGFAAACGGATGPAGLLEFKVTLGPIAPVEQPGDGPNSRPYAASVDIETPEGDVVVTRASLLTPAADILLTRRLTMAQHGGARPSTETAQKR